LSLPKHPLRQIWDGTQAFDDHLLFGHFATRRRLKGDQSHHRQALGLPNCHAIANREGYFNQFWLA